MAQKGTLFADDLRQRLELLELRFDQEKAAYTWEVRRACWGGVSFDERSNLFSSVGIGARGASIVIRPDRLLTLHGAMRLGDQFLFLTSIVLSDDRSRLEIRAAVCARPQDRTGRDAYNRPVSVSVPSFTFPGILTEKYFRNEADDVYRAEVQQRVLVTPKVIVLRAGDLVQKGNETPYTVRQVLDLDPYKNEYVIERSWEA